MADNIRKEYENMRKLLFEQKIKNRNSWFKIIFISIISISILTFTAIKFWDAEILITDFDFNALLSVIIAFFAIGLSVAFYNMASKSSDKFYSDIFKFIKKLSKSIGKMDAKFGEKMQNLDDNYNRVFNHIPNADYSNKYSKELVVQSKEREDLYKELIEVLNKLSKDSRFEKEYSSYIKSIFERLTESSDKIRLAEKNKHEKEDGKYYIEVSIDGNIKRIYSDEILTFSSFDDELIVQTSSFSYPIGKRYLSDVLGEAPGNFAQCSSTVIVNVKNIKRIEAVNGIASNLIIILKDGIVTHMAKRYAHSVLNNPYLNKKIVGEYNKSLWTK